MNRKILSFLFVGLIELVIIMELLNFCGFGITPIISPSMTPTLPINSLIITYKAPIETIQQNDIIEFRLKKADSNYMHRVLFNWGTTGTPLFKTKGDANEHTDGWLVTADEYKGKLIYHINWIAPLVTLIFGSFLTISKIRLVIGLILVGFIISLFLGLGTIGLLKIFFLLKKGVNNHENQRITNRCIYGNGAYKG